MFPQVCLFGNNSLKLHLSNDKTADAEITNSKGDLCNEGEVVYFLMNQEKAKEMGFLHCEVEE